MISKVATVPTYARPLSVVLLRGDAKIPLELAFEGVDHKEFGLWKVCTKLRTTDRLMVEGLGYNYVRAEYEVETTP